MPPALDPEAAGLIRAVLTRDRFAIDQILTHAFKSDVDVDGLYFASLVAHMAGGILAEACGSKAPAVALVDDRLDAIVRERVRAAELQLDISLGLAFCPQHRLVFCLGFPLGS